MYKTKKSPIMRAASAAMALALIATCGVAGSVAKYTSATTGDDTATVAKWHFEVNDVNFATQPEQTLIFDLFTTSTFEEDGSTADDSVKAGLIAPGTGGQFALKVENLSEVDAKFGIVLEETNANDVFIQYSLDQNEWYDDFAAINSKLTDADHALVKETGAETVNVYWRWCFNGNAGDSAVLTDSHQGQNDVADTALGIMGQTAAPTVTVKATLTATQVD